MGLLNDALQDDTPEPELEGEPPRQGYVYSVPASVVLHLVLTLILLSRVQYRPIVPEPEVVPEVSRRVLLAPPASVLRNLARPREARRPTTAPTPPPPKLKDRISIGPPVAAHQKGPLILRKEDDLMAVPKGRPDALPSPAEASLPPVPEPVPSGVGDGATSVPGAPGLRLPPGAGPNPPGANGARAGSRTPSITSSLRNLDRRLGDSGPIGLPNGTGQQLGPLFFDPQGADFTAWINNFKNEVYRNWIMPQPAIMGVRGHVDLQFTVLRNGSIVDIRILKSSGTPAMDRAAVNALAGSREQPLPSDFAPDRVTMEAGFYYNEGPQGS